MDRIFEQQANWREIAGEEGFRITISGQVYSQWIRDNTAKSRPRIRINEWRRIDKPILGRYTVVNLIKRRQVRVHVLMLETFIGPRPFDAEIRHFPDREKSNSALSNLSYGTPKENRADQKFHGTESHYTTFKGPEHSGENHVRTLLTNEEAIEIRHLSVKGKKGVELAEQFNVSQSIISRILKRKTYKHV